MRVHYLEIVTLDVDATCAALAKLHGVTCSEPEAGLGNARTAALANGGKVGVRAPMAEAEEPVVRPYLLVDDIEAAAAAAVEAGGDIGAPRPISTAVLGMDEPAFNLARPVGVAVEVERRRLPPRTLPRPFRPQPLPQPPRVLLGRAGPVIAPGCANLLSPDG